MYEQLYDGLKMEGAIIFTEFDFSEFGFSIWIRGMRFIFRRKHDPDPSYDLTIKTSDDEHFIKNIEVKGVTSPHPSKIADNIKKADKQIAAGDTIAIYLPNHRNSETGRRFADEGIAEARRKGLIKGPVEVWFSDKTKNTY